MDKTYSSSFSSIKSNTSFQFIFFRLKTPLEILCSDLKWLLNKMFVYKNILKLRYVTHVAISSNKCKFYVLKTCISLKK